MRLGSGISPGDVKWAVLLIQNGVATDISMSSVHVIDKPLLLAMHGSHVSRSLLYQTQQKLAVDQIPAFDASAQEVGTYW